MQLTDQQQQGLDKLAKWLADPADPDFVLTGFAGTGKSTIMKQFLDDNRGPSFDLMAPTGKAAKRLAEATGRHARTIHSTIFEIVEETDDEGNVLNVEWKLVMPRAAIAIVDEASMLSPELAAQLREVYPKVLYVGDPFQLPPVNAVDWLSMQRVDHHLTEVHRQALDSPILRLATRLRSGGELTTAAADGKSLVFVSKRSIDYRDPKWAGIDQLICATNRTRSQGIVGMRATMGRKELVEVGERLVVVKNWRERQRSKEDRRLVRFLNLMNGEQVMVEGVEKKDVDLRLTFDNGMENISIHTDHLKAHTDPAAALRVKAAAEARERISSLQVDYAYCITCHKAQGSQWGVVGVIDDGGYMKADERKRWQYTAVTRAEKGLIYAI